MLNINLKVMARIEDYLIDVELSPSAAESPLKQVEDFINSVKDFLTANLYSKGNIFKMEISLNPDNIFSSSYLKSIIYQRLNLFFNYSPPLINYTEGMNETCNYYSIEFQCFDDKIFLKQAC